MNETEREKIMKLYQEGMEKLTYDQQKVLEFRYGTDGPFTGRMMAFEHVAALMSKSVEEVEQLHTEGLRALRRNS